MIQEKQSAAVAVTTRLVEFLRDLSSASMSKIQDVARYQEVMWLHDLPPRVTPFWDATSGNVVLSFEAVPAEPAPQLSAQLQGWVDESMTRSSDGDDPVLAPEGEVRAEALDGDDWALLTDVYELDEDWRVATIEAKDAPGVSEAWRRYEQTWQVWAAEDREQAGARRWHGHLARIAHQLTQQDDLVELVLATGLLTWLTPAGLRIRNHVMTTRVIASVDPTTGRVDVRVADGGSTRMQDRDVLHGQDGFDPIAAEVVRQEVRQAAPAPLGDQVKEQLERWRALSLARCHPYRHEVEPQGAPTSATELRFAPALVLRDRDRSSLIDYYDQMLDALSGPEATAPLGLAQLTTSLDPEERLEWLESDGASPARTLGQDPLFPLPANPEQAQIITRLGNDNGVVVQGPPGTGKTHTIANLVSALLARGQRVLVTSQKAQALRVLRDKMPPEIQQLCVSMTDLGRGGSAELSRSVNAMSERYASFNADQQRQSVTDVAQRRSSARRQVSLLTEQIRALREAEFYQHTEIAPGYSGALSVIVQQLARHESQCGWMPLPVPTAAATDTPQAPPLNAAEAEELRRLHAQATPQRASRAKQILPRLDELPTSAAIRALVVAEASAQAIAAEVETLVSKALSDVPEAVLADLSRRFEVGQQGLREVGLPVDPLVWDAHDWRVRALQDLFAGREQAVWTGLAAVSGQAEQALASRSAIGLRTVTLPDLTASGPHSAAAQLAAGSALRVWLAGGNQLKRMFKPAVQKNAELLLEGSAVDGIAPTTVELLDLILAQLTAQVTADALAGEWNQVGLHLDATQPLARRVAQLDDAHRQLGHVLAVGNAVAATATSLTGARLNISLRSPLEWVDFGTALQAVSARAEARAATALMQDQTQRLELQATASAPPELAEMASVLRSRDAEAYEDALRRLAGAYDEQHDQARCELLDARLRRAHPALATELAASPQDPVWGSRFGSWASAWGWGVARSFFDEQRRPGRERQLQLQLADASVQVDKLTAELAAAQAWLECLQRMTAKQATALRSYQQHISDRGKGTGRYAHLYERAAREAMVEARNAVPAWIMPLPEVLETIPPERNSFDVVIIDEASQASLESLFLLWLAPRVIVVGDDKQCAPSAVTHGELQPIFDKLDEYLPDLPNYLRVAFTPNSSLFSLLATRFGSVIRLREHFRCMPEIIDWSSRSFYSDTPLVPLRQFGADRLPPLKVRYVPGAMTEGTATRLRNDDEAEALVNQILLCDEDPAYKDKTFGVVVLQGTGQVQRINDLLQERMRPEEWERRRLRIGTPPDFQGDERHFMFLSLVIADRRPALTRRDWQRRFNVAASRAQDQMWLFHSVTPDLLKPDDLRRSLMDYMRNPPAPQARGVLDDVREDEKHPAFDSLFEQRVFLRIRDRGYQVTPQVEVNGRRIDLVVTGAKGRLAVECDGDAFHSSPSQVASDLDRERELQRAGWRFWRVRESEYYFDPEDAMAGLWSDLQERGIHPHETFSHDAADVYEDEANPDNGLRGNNEDTVADGGQGNGEWAPLSLSEAEGYDGLGGDSAADLDTVVWSPPAHQPTNPRRAVTSVGQFTLPSRQRPTTGRPPSWAEEATTGEVRQWAQDEGYSVGERGRLKPNVIEAYNQMHPERPHPGLSS